MRDDSGSDHGLPATVAAAWGVQQRPTKGPRPRLGIGSIVEAAVAVADADGLDAVSMNRVARALGTSAMSLYRYVASKDQLLALMVDDAYGGTPPRVAGEDWRAGLSRWAWGTLGAIRAHPWVLRLPITGPPIMPNQSAWFEDALATLADTRLAEGEKGSVVLVVSGYVRGQAQLMTELATTFLSAAPTPDEAMRRYVEQLRTVLDRDRFPALHRMLDSGVFDRADPPDDEFAFGLERILDGVEVLVRARAGG